MMCEIGVEVVEEDEKKVMAVSYFILENEQRVYNPASSEGGRSQQKEIQGYRFQKSSNKRHRNQFISSE